MGALVSSASGQLHPDWLDDAWGQTMYQCSHIFPLLPAECGWMLCHRFGASQVGSANQQTLGPFWE